MPVLFVGIRFMRMSRMFFGGLAGICDCAVELLSHGRGKMSLHTCRLFAVCMFASALHAPELSERRPLGACRRPIYGHRRGTTNKHRQRLVGCLAQRDANTELSIQKTDAHTDIAEKCTFDYAYAVGYFASGFGWHIICA